MESRTDKYTESIQLDGLVDAGADGLPYKLGPGGRADMPAPTEPVLYTNITVEPSKHGISIQKTPTKKRYGPYCFTAKDTSTDAPLLDGLVGFKESITMTMINGDPAITIEPEEHIKSGSTPDTHYSVSQDNICLGTVSFSRNPKNISLANQRETKEYILNKTGSQEKEITISRVGSDEPVVKIHFSCQKGYEPFDSTLEFEEITGLVTELEKKLFLAVAVTYMMKRNGRPLTQREHNISATLGVLFGMLVLAGIITGFVYLVAYLNAQCNRPGYYCKGKHKY